MRSLLVLDTCGLAGYVAVVRWRPAASADFVAEPGGTLDRHVLDAVYERHLSVRATQEELLPAIDAVLLEGHLRLKDLHAVAVVHGPGSFTGVRIGLATAKGLCEAGGVPLVVLSRLAVLAAAAEGTPVWAWLEAGRGEVYAARFGELDPGSRVEASERTHAGAVCPLEAARRAAGSEPVAVCEPGLLERVPGAQCIAPEAMTEALRSLAIREVEAGRWADVALVDALYLRVPDAELALRARQG